MADAPYIVEAEKNGGGFPVFCKCGNQIKNGTCPLCDYDECGWDEDDCKRRPGDE